MNLFGFDDIPFDKTSVRSALPSVETTRAHYKITLSSLAMLSLVATMVGISGCSHGLGPINVQPGFGGTVRFVSAWPPPDSVLNLSVVAFSDYPPQNIITEITSGHAQVYPPISGSSFPTFVDSASYEFNLDSASTFKYVAVVMQYGTNLFADWEVVGAYGYSHGAGSPAQVVVPQNTFVNGINIDVDFKNLPPNPLGTSVSKGD